MNTDDRFEREYKHALPFGDRNEGPIVVLSGLVVALFVLLVLCHNDRAELRAQVRANRQPASGVTETHNAPVLLPSCYEDEALVGAGEFEHGRWTSYVCGGAVDDYKWGDE